MKTSAKVAIVGAVLFAGSLLLGVGGTVLGMIRAFSSVAESSSVPAAELSASISDSLMGTVVVVPLALIGLCLIVGGGIVHLVGRGKATAPKEQDA